MDRKYYCKCLSCGHFNEFKDLNDSYIICEECNKLLTFKDSNIYVDGSVVKGELQLEILNTLNSHNKSKTILLEGDDVLDDSI